MLWPTAVTEDTLRECFKDGNPAGRQAALAVSQGNDGVVVSTTSPSVGYNDAHRLVGHRFALLAGNKGMPADFITRVGNGSSENVDNDGEASAGFLHPTHKLDLLASASCKMPRVGAGHWVDLPCNS